MRKEGKERREGGTDRQKTEGQIEEGREGLALCLALPFLPFIPV